MRWLMGVVGPLFCAAINVPFVLEGSMLNLFAAGMCTGLALAGAIFNLIFE